MRLLIAFIYLALPHSSEVLANVTNTQWHLGLLAFLIVIAQPSRQKGWRVFDIAAVLISAISGPICLLMTPVAAIKYWQRARKMDAGFDDDRAGRCCNSGSLTPYARTTAAYRTRSKCRHTFPHCGTSYFY